MNEGQFGRLIEIVKGMGGSSVIKISFYRGRQPGREGGGGGGGGGWGGVK